MRYSYKFNIRKKKKKMHYDYDYTSKINLMTLFLYIFISSDNQGYLSYIKVKPTFINKKESDLELLKMKMKCIICDHIVYFTYSPYKLFLQKPVSPTFFLSIFTVYFTIYHFTVCY